LPLEAPAQRDEEDRDVDGDEEPRDERDPLARDRVLQGNHDGARGSLSEPLKSRSMGDIVEGIDRLETPERVDLRVGLAGVGSRGLACLLDSVLIGAALVVLGFTVFVLARIVGAAALILMFAGGFLLQWFYFAVFEAVWDGQTPGKRAVGLRVQKEGGYPIGW